MANSNIERRIIIGLITSTEFVQRIRDVYSPRLLESSMAKRLATWCVEYFDKYETAPGAAIRDIYYEKLKNGLSKEVAEEIEQDILPDLSEEFVQDPIELKYLTDQAKKYFAEKHLQLHGQQIEALISEGKVEEAEALAAGFKPSSTEEDTSINFKDEASLNLVEKAFEEQSHPLITFPKQLGTFWNHQFIEGAFVALLASEKRGKSYWLMELAKQAVRNGYPVAFFQAGDMSEKQQLRRFCINLTRNSDLERYCGEMYEPVRDCIHNQRGTCTKEERECDFGIFESKSDLQIRKEITIDELKEAYEYAPDYKPCYNCKEYTVKQFGTPWIKRVFVKDPLSGKRASKAFYEYFVKNKRSLMLSTHANGTLSTAKMDTIMNTWEKKNKFIPRVIILDYADLMVCKDKVEFRHQQNQIWKDLRGLSQKYRGGHLPLVITVTQADANSYEKDLLSLKNFSEDKRKYAHVTAMYGLNQDHTGREKKIGIMRINELVIREGDFDNANVCYVLQNLRRGQPFLGSYF
jgi:hypothetical protein